ncbi:MAG: hypothetical protein IJT23_05395 [Clostridia bacterium]|nr:hypothetical protein [Clostridia bacterium]
MINCCSNGCAKAAGLAALSLCVGLIAGMFLPWAAVAILEMACLIFFGYLCLFKW